MNDNLRKLILKGESSIEIKKAARESGMVTLREASIKKMLVGATTVEEVLRLTIEDE
jgi:type IV pilus assembly protein PilB